MVRDLRARVRRLLREGAIAADLDGRRPILRAAIAVLDAGRESAGWVVPLTVGTRLAGFAQFDASGTFQRYASFIRRPGGLEEAPESGSWLSASEASRRAERALRLRRGPAARAWLSFDREPSRLAWRVEGRDPARGPWQAFVAGSFAWRIPQG